MRRKSDTAIGERTFAAVHELFPDKTTPEIAKIIGCRKQAIYAWERGETPSGIFLQRMAFLGADIDWILTGRRKNT